MYRADDRDLCLLKLPPAGKGPGHMMVMVMVMKMMIMQVMVMVMMIVMIMMMMLMVIETSWAGMCRELMTEIPVFRNSLLQVRA